MFTYKFKKGTIRTGVAIDLATNDIEWFERSFGKFIEFYDDGEHTKEELECVYAFVKISEDDEEHRELIFTKDKDEVDRMLQDDRYELAEITDVESMSLKKPINFICADGFVTLTEEKYKKDRQVICKRNYITVSWMKC